MLSFVFLVFVSLYSLAFLSSPSDTDACTAILVGRRATVDGSAMTTHNNDCTDCDIRIVHVPQRTHYSTDNNNNNNNKNNNASHSCAVWPCKFGFPRFHSPSNQRGRGYSNEALLDHGVENFPFSKPFTHIEQVPFTFGYIDGTYGLVNSAGLAMGESTCGAKIVSYGYPQGDALLDVSALGRLALERCDTAKCAVKTMGRLAETYGYYGANDPAESGPGMYEEAGEALTIIDASGDAWVFHVLPDDTGKSAIWAAQRLAEDHVAVVSNSFIIGPIDFNDDGSTFLYSSNVMEIAVRLGFWPAGVLPFDFSRAYSTDGLDGPGWGARRTWRVFDLVAPTRQFDPDTPNPLPFSVKTERLLTLEDVKAFTRDRFEGSRYDLAKGPAAGPAGNPNRYDGDGRLDTYAGYFERAISLHRTSYAFVAQSRPWVPRAPTVLWFAQHSPHSSLFVPFYANVDSMPKEYEYGTLFRFERNAAWWAYAAVNNYAEKQYNFMSQDIKSLQNSLESAASALVSQTDADISNAPSTAAVTALVTRVSTNSAQSSLALWWQLLDFLVTRYRDGQRIETLSPPLITSALFYPSWWLGSVGYYAAGPYVPSAFLKNPPQVQEPPHPEKKYLNGDDYHPTLKLSTATATGQAQTALETSTVRVAATGCKRRVHAQTQTLIDNELERGWTSVLPASTSSSSSGEVETEYVPVAVETAAVSTLGVFSVSVLMMLAFVAGRHFEKRRSYIEMQ